MCSDEVAAAHALARANAEKKSLLVCIDTSIVENGIVCEEIKWMKRWHEKNRHNAGTGETRVPCSQIPKPPKSQPPMMPKTHAMNITNSFPFIHDERDNLLICASSRR